MAAPQTPAWLDQFLQQNNLSFDQSGNVITRQASPSTGSSMVKPLGNTAYAGGSSTFNEAAGAVPVSGNGTSMASQPGIDESRLFNGTWNPNSPPIFRTSDITYSPATAGQPGAGVSGVGQQWNAQTAAGMSPQAAGWRTPGSMTGRGTNWDINFGANNPSADGFNLAVKNSRGTAMNYGYTKDPTGQYWVPGQQGTGINMYTNPADSNSTLGLIAASALGVYGAGAYGAAAGAAGGATEAAAPAAVDMGGFVSPGAGAGVGGTTGATGGIGAMETAQAGTGAIGAGSQVGGGGSSAPSYTTGSDTNFGSTPGGNNASVNPNGGMWNSITDLLSGNGSMGSVGSSLWDYVQKNPQVLGSLFGAIGGSLGSNAITGNNSAAAQQASSAYDAYGTRLSDIASKVQQNGTFTPVGYTNANGSSQFDPATNTWKTSLSPQSQQQSDMWSTLGQQSLARNQNLDPNAIASQRYGDVQKLLAPQRAMDLESSLGTLASKGLLGQGVNQGTGQGPVNPLLAALKGNQSQQDLQLAMASQDYGMNQQNAGLSQLAGLFGQQQGVNAAANATMNPALAGTDQEMLNKQRTNAMWAQLMQGSAGAQLQSALPNQALLSSQNTRDGGNYGMWTDMIANMFRNQGNGNG